MAATVSYFESLEAYQAPVHTNILGHPIWVPGLSYWTKGERQGPGVRDPGLTATYNYSQDLVFEAAWYHLFAGDGLKEGNFSLGNGLVFTGGQRQGRRRLLLPGIQVEILASVLDQTGLRYGKRKARDHAYQ